MKFTDTVESLQDKNPGTIILVKNGIFFVALGKDAIVLNEEVGLKRTCMRDDLCKVGFLVKSSEKYIKVMREKDLSFALYVMDKKNEIPEEICRYMGKKHNELRCALNCAECMCKKESDDDVLERLKKFGK